MFEDMNKTVLKVINVSNVYINTTQGFFGKKQYNEVLKAVSLSIDEGEIFGLVGESGCGKTTLGRAVLGLVDYSGEIIICNQDRKTGSRFDFAKKVQAVFQDPSGSLNPCKRVGWILEEPLLVNRMGTRTENAKRVDEILELVGLDTGYRSRRVYELSGGQKQRVAIASALMLSPRLIIADEAVSALDVSVGAQILNLLKELHERLRLSMLFISHSLDIVYYLCDKIAVMRGGIIVENGRASDIYANPKHEYTKQLLNS